MEGDARQRVEGGRDEGTERDCERERWGSGDGCERCGAGGRTRGEMRVVLGGLGFGRWGWA